jgi:hypothetical protein
MVFSFNFKLGNASIILSKPKTETEIIAFDEVRRTFISLMEIGYSKEVEVCEYDKDTKSFKQVG